jgi:hypothetical protein
MLRRPPTSIAIQDDDLAELKQKLASSSSHPPPATSAPQTPQTPLPAERQQVRREQRIFGT